MPLAGVAATGSAQAQTQISNNGANTPIVFNGDGADRGSFGGSGSGTLPAGGNGTDVTATASGQIDGTGTPPQGISISVVGGDGGSVSQPAGFGFTPSVDGGNGGAGGAATLTSTAALRAVGTGANAIQISTDGGAGGEGGETVFADAQHGGTGGDAGKVDVTLEAPDGSPTRTVHASGTGSTALGVSANGGAGGGGQGSGSAFHRTAIGSPGGKGAVVTVDLSDTHLRADGKASGGIWVQASGGEGGQGGANQPGGSGGSGQSVVVRVDKNSAVRTQGIGAPALFLESNGGAGGPGGSSQSGGAAGAGGKLDVAIVGSVSTHASGSMGVAAHSYAGAGGAGAPSIEPFFASGGAGGAGANGGRIGLRTTDTGKISTSGAGSIGLLGQSVGGGGGNGGSASALWAIGGQAGGAGNGSSVNVDHVGSISTKGAGALGIAALSVGGGGGLRLGSAAGGNGGAASGGFVAGGGGGSGGGKGGGTYVRSDGIVHTDGSNSHAILAHSIGGGGGVGGGSFAGAPFVSVGVGGAGGAGGDAGPVTLNSNLSLTADTASKGDIRTTTAGSYGLNLASIGGGGGDGGGAIAEALSFPVEGNSFAVAVAVGGSGGSGGHGGPVTINNISDVTTLDQDSVAIYAGSVGGGGGSGGHSTAYSAVPTASFGAVGSASISVGVGGKGSTGGDGGVVNLANVAKIVTSGDLSHGLLAHSVGGGGGNGGNAEAASTSVGLSKGRTLTTSVSVGGGASGGGHGGRIEVHNYAPISTFGHFADAVIVQSVGGGGGVGGAGMAYAPQVVALNPKGKSGSVAVSVGGSGGAGGDGGDVRVENAGVIKTARANSRGILVQSVGGGGGSGGGGQANSAARNGQISVTVGATGGDGGDGGLVSVSNDAAGTVATSGNGGIGIVAQSIGGGGGIGGSATGEHSITEVGNALRDGQSVVKYWKKLKAWLDDQEDPTPSDEKSKTYTIDVVVGGKGGQAGDGEGVRVENDGSVTTNGSLASAILAQSVGGGGGVGGSATGQGGGYGGTVTVGRTGGSGGTGGVVRVTNTGTLSTRTSHSMGVLAQSVGGGGGMGGSVQDKSSLVSSAGVAIRHGGAGGDSTHGGLVGVTNSGAVTTHGNHSYALAGQSIGGGGGHFFIEAEEFDTTGKASPALEPLYRTPGKPQNAGGSADGKSLGLSFSLGGTGGGGGDGGDVNVTNSGHLVTHGDDAFAILGQSVGGGGGSGGLAQSYPDLTGILQGYQSPTVGSVNFGAEGGDGGAGGKGGDVNVVLKDGSRINTTGTGSAGIFAQSIGGGGGHAGGVTALGVAPTVGNAGATGATGNAGNISITADTGIEAHITTSGYGAHGIFAQTNGPRGGGGSVGSYHGLLSAYDANMASGKDLSGLPGTILVDHWGDISATGEGSVGIYAEALNGTVQNASTTALSQIEVIAHGDITGGSGPAGAGIAIAGGGANNRIVIDGGTVRASPGGFAIAAAYTGPWWTYDDGPFVTSPITSVVNRGTVIGNVDLGVNYNMFTNAGTFYPEKWVVIDNDTNFANSVFPASGPPINGRTQFWATLFAQNRLQSPKGMPVPTGDAANTLEDRFVDAGILNVWGPGAVGFTNFYVSNYEQTPRGVFEIDLDLQGANADQVRFQSDLARVTYQGRIEPRVVALPTDGFFLPEMGPVDSSDFVENLAAPVIQGGSGSVDISSATIVDSIALDYTLQADADFASQYNLGIASVDFTNSDAVSGSVSNEVASAVQSLWEAGTLGTLGAGAVALSNIRDATAYNRALKSISSEGAAQSAIANVAKGTDALDTMHSCPVFKGEGALPTETPCVWGEVTGGNARLFGDDTQVDFSAGTVTWRAGGQAEVGDALFLGGTLAIGRSWTDASNDVFHASADDYAVGLVAKKRFDETIELSGSVAYGFSDGSANRIVPLANLAAKSNPETHTVAARLRGAYYANMGDWYVKPRLDLDTVYSKVSAHSERGAGAWNLHYQGEGDVGFAVRPGVGLGARIDLESATVRPYLKAGVALWSDRDFEQKARLEGAGGGTGPLFTNSYDGNEFVGEFGAGLDYVADNGVAFRLKYDLEGNTGEIGQSVSARLAIDF